MCLACSSMCVLSREAAGMQLQNFAISAMTRLVGQVSVCADRAEAMLATLLVAMRAVCAETSVND